jgi:hypothetical protein
VIGTLAVAALLLGTPAATASPNQQEAAQPWEVVVRPFEKQGHTAPRLFWVGLRNRSPEARAFCNLGVTYLFDLPNGETKFQSVDAYPSRGSPHPCTGKVGSLVLGGETHFVKVEIELPADALLGKGIRFQVTADETCVAVGSCRTSRIIVSQE